MAGDVDVHEEAIVVDAGAAPHGVDELAAVVREGGGATHQYGRQVLIAAVPPHRARAIVERQVPGATVTAEAAAIPESARGGLVEVEALGLEAFALRQSEEYAAAKASRHLDGELWDYEPAAAPAPPDYAALEAPGAGLEAGPEAGAPPARARPRAQLGIRLGGRVAVGLIIVEGPADRNLQFTAAEQTQVVAEVQNALSWLGSFETTRHAASVTWVYDIQKVTLDVTPDYPTTVIPEPMEAPWRDPAMNQLGFEAGLSGVEDYLDELRGRLSADSAYCAFFTKYPLYNFAYVSSNIPRLVTHYNNPPWGPEQIDRVFAHNTGHIFGAPDEHATSNCTCGGAWGPCQRPNGNCVTCAPNGGVPCIMVRNDWQMCDYTPFHLGLDVKVPEVRRQHPDAAAKLLRQSCLEPDFRGEDTATGAAFVHIQSPVENTLIPPLSKVTCEVASGEGGLKFVAVPSGVVGGVTTEGRVELQRAAPAEGYKVFLSSDFFGLVRLEPEGVIVPAGSKTADFTIFTERVENTIPVTITATDNIVTKTDEMLLFNEDIV